MTELASAVAKPAGIMETCSAFIRPYRSIESRSKTIATEIYGGGVGELFPKQRHSRGINELGFNKFPVCIAKTQKSLSDDEKEDQEGKEVYDHGAGI